MKKQEAINILIDTIYSFITPEMMNNDPEYKKERDAIKVLTKRESKEIFK